MKYEFETVTALTVAAKMRSSDLVVTASELTAQVVVTVEPRRGGEEAVAATRVELQGDTLVIEAPKTSGAAFRPSLAVVVEVEVPLGTSLDAETGSGDLRTFGPLVRVDVRNGSGDCAVARAEQLTIASGSGDVTVEESGLTRITSGSGDVRLGRATAKAELRAGSGDVVVDDAADLSLVTGSGDGIIGAAAGVVSLTSGSGDLTVRRASAGEIQAKTASGDVVVGVEPGVAALLDCSSIRGRVSSDLSSGDAPGEEERGVVLRIRAVTGDVRVQRA